MDPEPREPYCIAIVCGATGALRVECYRESRVPKGARVIIRESEMPGADAPADPAQSNPRRADEDGA